MSEQTKTQLVVRPPGKKEASADAILADIGKHFRRIDDSGRKDASDLNVVWHQSKLQTEMLSWESDDKTIDRQELSFFGKMLEFRKGSGLRTGDLPSSRDTAAGNRISRSQIFKPSRDLDVMVLHAASNILRVCKRDLYTQHLLAEVSAAIAVLEKQANRTQVRGLGFFREIELRGMQAQEEHAPTPPRISPKMIVGIILGVSLAISAALFWLLFTRA